MVYDAGHWFVGVAGNFMEGENKITGVGLANLIQPRKIVTTAGVRLLERRLTLSAQWISFAAQRRTFRRATCRRRPATC